MIGTLNTREREVTVVGAGAAGLLAAYHLDRQGYRVTLLEAGARAGGLIQTTQTPFGITESAAHSLLATPAVERLFGELGVELLSVNRASKARYIWRAGKLRRFPLNVTEALEAVWRMFFVRARAGSGASSLAQWARRHLGTAVVDYLLAPFLNGIYAASPERLTVSAIFPKLSVPERQTLAGTLFRQWRARERSSAKSRPMTVPRAGMGALTSALERELTARLGERFSRNCSVDRLPVVPNLVLAVPADAAAKLLSAAEPALARALTAVSYSPLISATVFVETSAFAKPVNGVGVLLPPREGRAILGVLFNSSAFEGRVSQPTLTSLTVMLAGSEHPELLGLSDDEVRRLLSEELVVVLNVKAELTPERCVIHRWPRAIPAYSAELEEVWRLASASWCAKPGHLLFGNYTGQISIRGLIETAENIPSYRN